MYIVTEMKREESASGVGKPLLAINYISANLRNSSSAYFKLVNTLDFNDSCWVLGDDLLDYYSNEVYGLMYESDGSATIFLIKEEEWLINISLRYKGCLPVTFSPRLKNAVDVQYRTNVLRSISRRIVCSDGFFIGMEGQIICSVVSHINHIIHLCSIDIFEDCLVIACNEDSVLLFEIVDKPLFSKVLLKIKEGS